MTEKIEATVVESYAQELAKLWVANMTLSGAKAFRENEDKRKALLDRATELGIRAEVYNRATSIIHGA